MQWSVGSSSSTSSFTPTFCSIWLPSSINVIIPSFSALCPCPTRIWNNNNKKQLQQKVKGSGKWNIHPIKKSLRNGILPSHTQTIIIKNKKKRLDETRLEGGFACEKFIIQNADYFMHVGPNIADAAAVDWYFFLFCVHTSLRWHCAMGYGDWWRGEETSGRRVGGWVDDICLKVYRHVHQCSAWEKRRLTAE